MKNMKRSARVCVNDCNPRYRLVDRCGSKRDARILAAEINRDGVEFARVVDSWHNDTPFAVMAYALGKVAR